MDTLPDVFPLVCIGYARTPFQEPNATPKQGREAGLEGEILLAPTYLDAMADIRPGQRLQVVLWFHKARRDALRVHPKGDSSLPLKGVFSTRSPHRPNPLGLTVVEVLSVEDMRIRVRGLDALDGTPVVDIKSHIAELDD